ncbi:MAG: lytic transglycosylase domain-containing protein, partial [Pseudomonadota bacterium]
MLIRKTLFVFVALVFVTTGLTSIKTASPVKAQGIEQLLIERVPVPERRPNEANTVSSQSSATPQGGHLSVSSQAEQRVPTIAGSLQDGLRALDSGQVTKALGIREGMRAGSLDRKILAWAIALSGKDGVRSATITKIAKDLPDWPGQTGMRRNAERAMAKENISANAVVNAFSNTTPQSVEGAILLSRAYLDLGQKQKANQIIAPYWRNETLTKATERKVLDRVGAALTRADHRFRMHQLLYRDRATAATRIAGRAEQVSLAKARAAALRKSPKAATLIETVAPSSKRDTGYDFARIEHARRSGDYEKAADLLLKAPRDQRKLVDPDEWWVERRIVSRQMLELGKFRKAYRLAAEHSAQSPSDIAEAEFHAGWYALRFLKDKTVARRHFSNVLNVSKRPISQARGHYWLGRASSSTEARKHYTEAAKHGGTFYGQLAAVELGTRNLTVDRPRPSASDRNRLQNRELYRAIKRLEGTGYAWRADPVYRHLARVLPSPGELAILSADAERQGKFSLSLQIGKIAFGRGLEVDTLSWPIGAIPNSARIGNAGRALAYAIARQESAFDKAAISRANARGLLQLLPGTAKAVAKRNGLSYSRKRLTTDAGYNATLGSAYLSEQLERFGNSYILTFAAYNAGPGRVDEWLERFGDPRGKPLHQVIDWIEQIPFTETRHYVQRVMENYQVYKRRISNSRLTITQDLTSGRSCPETSLFLLCSDPVLREMRAVKERQFLTMPFAASNVGVRLGAAAYNMAEAMAALARGKPLNALEFAEDPDA